MQRIGGEGMVLQGTVLEEGILVDKEVEDMVKEDREVWGKV